MTQLKMSYKEVNKPTRESKMKILFMYVLMI